MNILKKFFKKIRIKMCCGSKCDIEIDNGENIQKDSYNV